MKTSVGSCDRLIHILIMMATSFFLLTEFGTLQATAQTSGGLRVYGLDAPHRQ